MSPLLGAVELGGTKAVVGVAYDPVAPLRRRRIPTTDPSTTLAAISAFFAACQEELGPLHALGVGSFGPLQVRPDSSDRGRFGRTPKPGWEGADLIGLMMGQLDCPLALDTDVNAAAIAEARWGSGKGLANLCYLTVGTGIGGGLLVNGRPVHGALHPEIGHMRIERRFDDGQASLCPYHASCAEGLASGPAIVARFGQTFEQLGNEHPFRSTMADYLGQVCATLVLVTSPERIVIGGGVMASAGIHGEVEEAMRVQLNGYVDPVGPQGTAFVVAPELGEDAGLAGAFALASDLLASAARIG